jgi:hypothetical protein
MAKPAFGHFYMKRKKENREQYLISRVVLFILFQELLSPLALAVPHGRSSDVPPPPGQFQEEPIQCLRLPLGPGYPAAVITFARKWMPTDKTAKTDKTPCTPISAISETCIRRFVFSALRVIPAFFWLDCSFVSDVLF